jgi:glycogen phosphorylase
MEVGLESGIPTYSGGLGGLAGDTLRAAADAGLPLVAVTLVHREGYLRQVLDKDGNQTETPWEWEPSDFLEQLPQRAVITLEGRPVHVAVWVYRIRGVTGHEVPVYLLDTRLPENDAEARAFTDHLYLGDQKYRLCQEAVLGIGGAAVLKALGHTGISTYHMNEGHSALLSLALLEASSQGELRLGYSQAEVAAVKSRCVFTTHTPVAAGHDQFEWDLVEQVLGPSRVFVLQSLKLWPAGVLNMTALALVMSRFANAVSKRHGEIASGMFPQYEISAITNGIHADTWASPHIARLFDRRIPGWREDNNRLSQAESIPLGEIWDAHDKAKRDLIASVADRTGVTLSPGWLTIGFARRATGYKRAGLLFSDVDRLRDIARRLGGIQVVYAGKAHPHDDEGKDVIRSLFRTAKLLAPELRMVYVTNYSMDMAREMCAGVDLWLNTPEKPREASGTSGMKAALNGVPSLSVLDGWWVEGHIEGVTGWSIGEDATSDPDSVKEAASLYDKLERAILPAYYGDRERWGRVMRNAMVINGPRFTAQNMLDHYVRDAYAMGQRALLSA